MPPAPRDAAASMPPAPHIETPETAVTTAKATDVLRGQTLVAGTAAGTLLWSDVGLSFWGGIDPASGSVIDRHHPLGGRCVRHAVLAIPGGRGSCTGSSVMLELLLSGNAPAALILAGRDDILLLGVLVAMRMFGHSIPVVSVSAQDFAALRTVEAIGVAARADGAAAAASDSATGAHSAAAMACPVRVEASPAMTGELELGAEDARMRDGAHGRARQVAMDIIVHMAQVGGARSLIDIAQAHIDGCIYTGPASLRFATQLVQWGGRVAVPTSLNAISVDRRSWRGQGIAPAFGEPAEALAQAYVDLGATPTYTCAPYHLDSAPAAGEHIAWAESNAVVYANSVIGARTAKVPDFLDILIALTGRAPAAECHLDGHRKARIQVDLEPPGPARDESLYPLLGYHVGLLSGRDIPVICGLEREAPNLDELRALGAAFATTSSAPMFHIAGVTPEAPDAATALGGLAPAVRHRVTRADLAQAWHALNAAAADDTVELVALGNPHFSAAEIGALAQLCAGRSKAASVQVVVTTSRQVLERLAPPDQVAALRAFGVRFVVDTCWCMLQEPVVPVHARTIMTNSGKYAHYAPGLVGRMACFGSLRDCVDVACSGRWPRSLPAWLRDVPHRCMPD